MFLSLFSNVAIMLVYLILGFLLCKTKKAEVSHAKSLSGILLYILSPAMIINSFLQVNYSKETFFEISEFFLVTFFVQLLFFGFLFLFFHKKYADSKYRILSVGSVLGNVGFLGMPLLIGLFPDNPIVQCYSSMNVISMNIIVFTVGVYLITNDTKFISLKSAIVNPASISILVALPLFFFDVTFPSIIENSISLLGKMVTPVCMFILGMRLSAANLKDVFTRPFVYITCIFKLIVFPVFTLLIVHYLPFLDDVAKASAIVLASVPSGAIIGSLAEMHECEQEFAANVIFLTTILSVITIPIMVMILV